MKFIRADAYCECGNWFSVTIPENLTHDDIENLGDDFNYCWKCTVDQWNKLIKDEIKCVDSQYDK